MSTFAQTINPTPFAFFDADAAFQTEADAMVTYVKTVLGDPILSVELSKKQIWACFESSLLEYGRIINEFNIESQLVNLLGQPTGTNMTNAYPRLTFEFLLRQTDPYSYYSDVGGAFDTTLGYIPLVAGQQDYNLYADLLDPGTQKSLYQSLVAASGSTSAGQLRVMDVLYFSPVAAQHFLLNASNVTNFLAQEMRYESYVNSTVFYVLPIFEDVLRRGMLEAAFRVRRSNYSYQINGRILRLFPVPTGDSTLPTNVWVRVAGPPNPMNPSFPDASITGSISNASNVPFNNITYSAVNSPGRQWVRSFTLALAKESLGQVRSKMKTIPIPGADLQLNGEDLIAQGREDKDKLTTALREFLGNLTYDKLIEREALKAENLNKQLKYLPPAGGKAIIWG